MPDKVTKFINSLDEKTRKRLKAKLFALKNNPTTGKDIKKLKGWGKDTYRLRMGKIRIIYRLYDGKIEIVDIDYRGNIY